MKMENNLKLFVNKKIMQPETFKLKTMVVAPLRVSGKLPPAVCDLRKALSLGSSHDGGDHFVASVNSH